MIVNATNNAELNHLLFLNAQTDKQAACAHINVSLRAGPEITYLAQLRPLLIIIHERGGVSRSWGRDYLLPQRLLC